MHGDDQSGETQSSGDSRINDVALTRRTLLTTGMAAAVGALTSVATPTPAIAADGDALRIGRENFGTSKTVLSSTAGPTLRVYYDGPDPFGEAGVAIHATGTIKAHKEGAGSAMYAESRGAPALKAYSTGRGVQSRGEDVGVEGVATGTRGQTGIVGVLGVVRTWDLLPKEDGVGVAGYSGVLPGETMPNGCGVRGVGSRTGVSAESPSGVALDVHGKAHFTRSGRALIGAAKTYRDIPCANLGTGSMILATLQGSGGTGVAVAYCARLSSTKFRVVLTRATTRSVYVAWFVLN